MNTGGRKPGQRKSYNTLGDVIGRQIRSQTQRLGQQNNPFFGPDKKKKK